MNADTDRGDLRALLAMLRRRFGLILLAVAVGVGAAIGVSKLQDKEYSSTASLLFRPIFLDAQVSGLPLSPPGDADRDAATNLRLVSLGVVRDRAAAKLGGGETADDLAKDVSVSADGQSNLVKVTGTAPKPEQAARIANTVAAAFVAFRRETLQRQIQQGIRRVRAEYLRVRKSSPTQAQLIRANLEKLRVLKSVSTGDVQFIEPADVPDSPSSPKTARNAVIGGFLGLLVGLALALLVEQLDRRPRRADQLEELLDMPVLAQVPRSRVLRRGESWRKGLPDTEREAFRHLRANLRYYGRDEPIQSLLVTSPDAESGKTTIALHLAAAAAAAGSRVLLVEADLRRPRLGKLLGLESDEGLSTMLYFPNGRGHEPLQTVRSNAIVDDMRKRKRLGRSGNGSNLGSVGPGWGAFEVLLAGPETTDPSELLDSEQMRSFLAWTREVYDLVVIDGPPPSLVSDAIPLIKQVDGVLLVGRLGRDSRGSLQQLRAELDRLDARSVGVVANFARHVPYGYYGPER